MISKIIGFKYKSWKNSSNLSSVDFNQINIIFGHNGAGKSSLARGVTQEYKKADKSKESIRLFGSKYTDSTLLIEDKSGIRGVVSNFGKKDVDLEKKILVNNNKIGEINTEIIQQSTERDALEQSTELLIKGIVGRRKDKNKKINNKPVDKTVQEKVKLWLDDYLKAHKDFPDEDYNQITGAMDFTAESDQVSNLAIPQHVGNDSSLAEKVATIFSKSFPKVDVPENDVVDWLQTGLHIHDGKSVCEFCGNKFEIDKVKTKIEVYLNDERHKASVQLKEYQKILDSCVEISRKISGEKSSYIALLELTDNNFAIINDASDRIADFAAKKINEKLNDMSLARIIPDTVSGDIKVIDDGITKLEEARKSRSKEITDKINRLETLLKGAIGFEIKNTQAITDQLKAIVTHSQQIKSLETSRDDLQKKNFELLSQKSDLADFALYLNDILSDLNLNFMLEPNNKCYVLKHADGSALQVTDISDGERNLLALVYYYYEMLGNSKGDLKDTIKLIIIDDPISSLDDNNKFYITELIRSMLNQTNVQVFVLTHSWDDFCNIAYGQDDKDSTSLFEINKKSGISFIEAINGRRLVKPYRQLYKEVYDFSQKDISTITDEEMLHLPNVMRRVVEDYIKFAVDVDFATAYKRGDIANALFREEIANLSNTQKQKLNVLLSICNILSHKANQPKNRTEVHQSAKFLMATIENNNKYHHLKMRS